MKKQTYYFYVSNEQHRVKADSAGSAMEWMNRQVMDKLNIGPFAWMDGVQPNTYYASAGNYWD